MTFEEKIRKLDNEIRVTMVLEPNRYWIVSDLIREKNEAILQHRKWLQMREAGLVSYWEESYK